MPLVIIENLNLEKPSLGPSKWPRKLKPAKNSKLPKWPENCFEPFGKGGWPSISTWIIRNKIFMEFKISRVGHNPNRGFVRRAHGGLRRIAGPKVVLIQTTCSHAHNRMFFVEVTSRGGLS
jgi:hypothetical protein